MNDNFANTKSWFELSEEENVVKMPVPQYLTMKIEDAGGKNFNNVSPFEIHKWISSFSKNINVRKLRKTGTLLLDCPINAVASKLIKQTVFNNLRISVTPHERLNTSKGVFYCNDLREVPDEEILQQLKYQGVTHIKRIGRNSSLFVATFGMPNRPEKLLIGYLAVPVRPYFPPPLICYRCGLIGHHESTCEKEPVCRKCSDPKHTGSCTKIKCCLCGEEHLTSAKTCKIYAAEFEIKKIMVERHISYNEAKKKIQSPKPNSYADAIKTNTKNEIGILISMISQISARIEAMEKLFLLQHSLQLEDVTSGQGKASQSSKDKRTLQNAGAKTLSCTPTTVDEASNDEEKDEETTELKAQRRSSMEDDGRRSQKSLLLHKRKKATKRR